MTGIVLDLDLDLDFDRVHDKGDGPDLAEQGHEVVIATLGPRGTSSETAARRLTSTLSSGSSNVSVRTQLHHTYESAGEAVTSGCADLLVVANAYAGVSRYYMDPAMRLAAAFIHETPLYGIAAPPGVDRPHRLLVASHPAPRPLIEELMPKDHELEGVVLAHSTSAAAAIARAGEVNASLTTHLAARLHGLEMISQTRTITMLWSVFCRADRPRRHASDEPSIVEVG